MTENNSHHNAHWETLWDNLDWDEDNIARQQADNQQQLHKRALQYAKPVDAVDAAAQNTRTILTFDLGDESYGVDVMVVRGIRLLSGLRITRVPGAARFYAGVVNIRGKITSVLDLRCFFNISADDQSDARELVIVNANKLEIGLLADHVGDVMTIPTEDIEPLDDMAYALGVTKARLIVLDIEQLFADERLIIGGGDE